MGMRLLILVSSLTLGFQALFGQGAYFDASVLKDPTGYKLRPGDRVRVVIQGEADCARPKALLSVTKYSERVVFLTGSVNRKGPYVFPPEVEAMNIVEVIARAGGFNDIAKKNRVFVTRTFFDESGSPTNTKTYEVNVEALSSGINANSSSRRFWIYPGDRIEVPERLL